MLPWLLGGLAIVTVIVWRVIHAAEVDDKQRKKLRR